MGVVLLSGAILYSYMYIHVIWACFLSVVRLEVVCISEVEIILLRISMAKSIRRHVACQLYGGSHDQYLSVHYGRFHCIPVYINLLQYHIHNWLL